MCDINKLTSNDIKPGPFSEYELREQWNSQADEFNQWDSLDSCKQLAWAQAQALSSSGWIVPSAVQSSAKRETGEAKARVVTVQTPSFEEMRDWILQQGQFSPCGTEFLQCLMLMTPAPTTPPAELLHQFSP
jgi:hypothetical protein